MGCITFLLALCAVQAVGSQTVTGMRRVGQRYTVELLAVVDNKAFDMWYKRTAGAKHEERNRATSQRVANFVSSIVVGVNNLYESASKYGLFLDVRLKELRILEGDVWGKQDLWLHQGEQISTQTALKTFYSWTWRTRSTRSTTFDHALLITGYDLIDPKDPGRLTQGVAYKSMMCRYGSVSVVENSFTYQIIDTTAHELGHSLGSDHDGQNNQCSNELGHVMSSKTVVNSTNRWSFSPCSISAVRRNIAELDRIKTNCLVKTSTVLTPGVELGNLMKADEQCRMTYGHDAFFCRDFYATSQAYTKMCQSMWCSANQSSSLCHNHIASDGFVCGHGKVCKRGACIPTPTPFSAALSQSDTCPQGDQPGVVYQNLTCLEVVSSQPWLCYRGSFQKKCCQSCPSIRQPVAGCEFGDKEGWCHTDMKYPYDCYRNQDICCRSCLQHRRQDQPDCLYGDRTSSCQSNLTLPIGCYGNDATCCETCAKHKSHDQPDCPYGDRSVWCQKKLKVPQGCYLNHDLCCGTCGTVANATVTSRLTESRTWNVTPSALAHKPLKWCLYGDRYPDWCQKSTPYSCYDPEQRQLCCKTCDALRKPGRAACEYGDRMKKCESLVFPYACYKAGNARDCCGTCGMYRNSSRPNCPYGDREAWCYKLDQKYTPDQWCHMDQQNGHCCSTCLYHQTDIPVFGSTVKAHGLPTPN